jgi:LuxR family transcriptional regulator, maltose regulon positive regulatory protein
MRGPGSRRLPSPRPPGPILLRTKLGPPPARAGLIPRSRLDAQLEAGAKGRLCLVDAPAGSGKTTLLAQWWRAGDDTRQLAWLSLDDGDDDPVRFWSYVIEAFRIVEPGLGEDALAELQGSGTTDLLTQVVLPQLLNELAGLPCDLVLVLDDYHLVTNAVCHASLGFFVDHLPANVHLIVATRADPPLALARLRASGELVELRIAELGFTSAEAEQLLGQAMGLELTAAQTRRLWERTEGWAAGLYLAGLSLQGRRDPGPFIASFEAGHRHVVDYLGAEVLARQPAALRDFMVRSSTLQRLSGPLATRCWRPRGRPSCWPSWSRPTCSSSPWTTTATGTATTICSPSCCAWSWPAWSPGWWRPCTGAPPPSTSRPATSRQPCTTPAPAATSTWPAP